MRSAGSPACRRRVSIQVNASGMSSTSSEKFTARVKPKLPSRPAPQSAKARVITACVSGQASPTSSICGTKRSGSRKPYFGSSRRARTSSPTGWPSDMRTIG
jgi:hypothetical protein